MDSPFDREYELGDQIVIASLATGELANEARKLGKEGYCFFKSDPERRSAEELIDLWADWCAKWPIFSIEDGLAEDDRGSAG